MEKIKIMAGSRQTIDLESNVCNADDIYYVNICNKLRTLKD